MKAAALVILGPSGLWAHLLSSGPLASKAPSGTDGSRTASLALCKRERESERERERESCTTVSGTFTHQPRTTAAEGQTNAVFSFLFFLRLPQIVNKGSGIKFVLRLNQASGLE